MNEKIIMIITLLLCNLLYQDVVGFSTKTLPPSKDSTETPFTSMYLTEFIEHQTTLIPPGRCSVSVTAHPSPAILGSLITFYSILNCTVFPPIEYQCCYYFWQDNLSDNVTVTAGLATSFLSKIYEAESVKKDIYLMEVKVCWQKISTLTSKELQQIVCGYEVAVNTTMFELTDTLNGILKFEQIRDFSGNPSVLMVGKPASAIFVPTDQRLMEMLIYKWNINGTDYTETNNSTLHFIPANVGMLSVELHVFDNISHQVGNFRHFIHCKDPILDAFIKGDKRLLVEDNGTFFLTYVGSAPFTFCWKVEPSDSPHRLDCIYDLKSTDGNFMGSKIFYIQARSQSGKQKILGNLTNDVSIAVLKYEFKVLARVNIRSGILVVILIVGLFMSSMLTYIFCRQQPELKRRLPVEVADFDFYPELTARTENSLRNRIRWYYDSRILPCLLWVWQLFKPAPKKQEMYNPLNGSGPDYYDIDEEESISASTTSLTSEGSSKNLSTKTTNSPLRSPSNSIYGTL